MSTYTIGQWIDLPTSGGAADRFRADQPGGAGLFRIAASNATLAARENGLRTLWEDYGSSNVYTQTDPTAWTETDWSREDSAGWWVRCAGVHRVRLYGEQSQLPRIELRCRALAPSTYTTGVMLVAMPALAIPSLSLGTYASDTTTSTSLDDLAVTLTLTPGALGLRPVSLTGAAGVEEQGSVTEVALWVAAWCTSASSLAKGALYGVSVFLREPAT